MGGLQVLLLLTLIITVHTQRWPVNGDCQPCRCYYKVTSLGRVRHVNCSQRGLQSIPPGLPVDLMTLDLSWNPLDLDKLRKHLCNFRSLSSVSLSFTELTTLSDIFEGCTSLLEVNLTGNRLTQLDFSTFQGLENLRRLLGLEAKSVLDKDVFQSLTNLKDLDLIFHGESLPKGLFNNLMIKSINLVLTKADTLPEGLFDFGGKTLNTLQLVGEQVKEMKSDLFDGLNVLKKLFLVMPQVQMMPESLFLIQQLNSSVARVANLQEVEITGVRSFPANLLRQLDNLESLQLKDIGSFPQEAFLSNLVNLKTLIITGGKITTIPSGWFKNLYSLKTLKISNAQLEELGDTAFEGLISLNYLDLSFNRLETISAKCLKPLNQTLETLALTGNMLTELSKKNTENITMLRYLDLSENRLSAVYADAFRRFTRLSVLYLSYNQISSLPINLFTDQFQLESLSLTNNYLSEFPVALLTLKNSLINLDLSFNEIRQIPAAQLCQFVYLEKVSIMKNPLHCDCHIMGFQKCPALLPEGICQTPEELAGQNLKDLKVSDSCSFAIESKASEEGVVSQEQNYVFTDGKKVAPNSRQAQPSTSSVGNDRSSDQQNNHLLETPESGENGATKSEALSPQVNVNSGSSISDGFDSTLRPTLNSAQKNSKTEPRLPTEGKVRDSVADAAEDKRLNISFSSKEMNYSGHVAAQNIIFKNMSGEGMNFLGHVAPQPESSSSTALLEKVGKGQTVKPSAESSENVFENDSQENTNRPVKQVNGSEAVLKSSSSSSDQALVNYQNMSTFENTHKVNTDEGEEPLFGEKSSQISPDYFPMQISMSKGHQNLPSHNQTKLPDIEPSTTNKLHKENSDGQISDNHSKSLISDMKLRNGTDLDQVVSGTENKPNVNNTIRSEVKNMKLVQNDVATENSSGVPLLDSLQTSQDGKMGITRPLQANVTISENSTPIGRYSEDPAITTNSSSTDSLTSVDDMIEKKSLPQDEQGNITDWSRKDTLISNTTLNSSPLLSTVKDNTANEKPPGLPEPIGEDREPLGKEIVNTDGEKDNTSRKSDSVAFNFTVGAISAILVFGAVVLVVYGVRRYRQQGNYSVSDNGEENIELEETATPPQFPSNRQSFMDFTHARPRPV